MTSSRLIDVGLLLEYYFNDVLEISCNNNSVANTLFFDKRIVKEGVYSDYNILIKQDHDNIEVLRAMEELQSFDGTNTTSIKYIEYPLEKPNGDRIIEQYRIDISFRHNESVSNIPLEEGSDIFITEMPCTIMAIKKGEINVNRY